MLNDPVSFEQYVLDPGARELRLDGKGLSVEPRVFDLLAYLVTHRGRAVSKDELQDAVWPGVIVSETALTRAVMKARRAVDDDAATQRLIKTVHGHGYRFVGEVRAVEAAAPATTPPPVSAPPSAPAPIDEPGGARSEEALEAAVPAGTSLSPTARRRPFAAALLMTLALAAAVAMWWSGRAGPPAASASLRVAVLPVVNDTGDDTLNWVDLGLMSLAGNGLSELGVDVLADANVVELSQNFGGGGQLADDASRQPVLERLRRLYGVSHVLAMRLTQDAGALRMDFSLYGPQGGHDRATMLGEETLRLAEAVTRSVGARLVGQRRLDVSHAGSGDAFVNEAYARGKGLALEGRCAEALPLLEVARTQDPALFLPRFERAHCLRLLGRTEEAIELFTALDREYTAQAPNRELADILNQLGTLYIRSDSPDIARTTLERGLAVADAVESAEAQAKLLLNLAILEKGRANLEEATALLGRSQLAYQAAGYDSPPGYVYNTLSNIAMTEGRYADAEGHLSRALAAWRNVGNKRLEAMALNNYGYLRRRQGRLDEAEPFHLQSLELREAIGDRVGVGRIRGMLAVLYLDRGDLVLAHASAAEALTIAREARDRLFEGTALAQLGEVELTQGAWAAAARHLKEAREVFAAIEDGLRELQVDVRLGRLHLALGEVQQAERLAQAVVVAAARGDGLAQVRVEGIELRGDVALARDDGPAALADYSAALSLVEALSWDSKEAALLAKLAQMQLAIGDVPAAEPYIGRLLDFPPTAQSLKARARYAAVEGDQPRARELMELARTAAGEAWREADEAELQRYGAQPPT